MNDPRRLDALPDDWREELAQMPDIEREQAIGLIERLERVQDAVDVFLIARDLGDIGMLLVQRQDEVKALQRALADLRARRLERISTLVRGEGGAILGSVTERVEQGKA